MNQDLQKYGVPGVAGFTPPKRKKPKKVKRRGRRGLTFSKVVSR